MKENYISFVLEEYISDGNFDAVFGDQWIDDEKLTSLYSHVCDNAFANYGIDAKGKYAPEVASIFEGLKKKNGILQEGDEYSDSWYKLRPSYKKKYLEEIRSANPAANRIGTLGDEVLRRALVKIVAEDDLRSIEEKWTEANPEIGADIDQAQDNADKIDERISSPNLHFFESETRKAKFVAVADNALKQVEDSDLSNAQKSQAQGFLAAAKALSETPDPPADLIWTILVRANSVAGIASFFVALITLIAMVV